MEYLSGGSLADLLKHGPYMDVPRALGFLRGAARGLHAAHELGIIHRDLKPDNLMLTREGKIKVVDFGLAVPGTLKGPRLTTEGTIIGTPHYMAPEQWESRDVDERSDIYSLGATFYHLFSGRTPYDGKTALELIANFSNTQKLEAPEKFNRALLPGISALILKMIQKRPEERLQGMTELLEALNAFG
jgi:serine/threonine protein kinase